MSKPKLLIFILGPTAIGKTKLSINLAQKYNCEIISADSRQFYRELKIGTAKPSELELKASKHHFIDSRSIEEDYNVFDFEKDVLKKVDELFQKDDIAIVVGGSGLYLHSIWNGIDDEVAGSNVELRNELNKLFSEKGIEAIRSKLKEVDIESYLEIDLNNHVRMIRAIEATSLGDKPFSQQKKRTSVQRPFNMLKIGLNVARTLLHQRINERVDGMMGNGLLNEAEALISHRNKNALQTVGYQELFRYFDGDISLDEAVEKIKVNTRRYAKRQLTWFRRYEDIYWFEPNDEEKISSKINELLNN